MLEPRGGKGLEPRGLDQLLPPLVPVQQDGRRLQVKLTHHHLQTANRDYLEASVVNPDMRKNRAF